MIVLTVYAWIVAIISVIFLLFALSNAIWFKSYTKKPSIKNGGKVTVCIPARNEEKNIEACVRSFLEQDYENFNIIVLDDNSEDATPIILDKLKKEYPDKITVLKGKALEEGWTGKIFAMNQIVQKADGEYLLFTDADTVHSKDSISFAVTNLTLHNADMMSGYIKEKIGSFGELITIPLMYMLSNFVLPSYINRITTTPATTAAIGQYIVIKRSVFESIGGYNKIKDLVSEDVCLARLIKKSGYKTIFIDCTHAASCRMYHGYKESVNGITKNIFSFMNNNDFLLILGIIGCLLFLTLPFPLFVGKLIYDIVALHTITLQSFLIGLNVAIMFYVWLCVALSQKSSIAIPFLYPLLFLNIVYIAIRSYVKTKKGKGYVWKGRVVH